MNIYFEDGLATVVPLTVLPAIKELLEILFKMHPSHQTLQRNFWQHCNKFKRFSISSQQMLTHSRLALKVVELAQLWLQTIIWRRALPASKTFSGDTVTWTYTEKILCKKILYWNTLLILYHEIIDSLIRCFFFEFPALLLRKPPTRVPLYIISKSL